MEVIILVALIFVIISLANKYLKVPRDNYQRYDGINNRFYGEGYSDDAPVPPTEDDESEEGRENLTGEETADQQGEDTRAGDTEEQREEEPGAGDTAENAPAEKPDFYGNTGDTQGVVIDTEVHVDYPDRQDPEK